MTHSLFIRLIPSTRTDSPTSIDWVLFNGKGIRIDGTSNVLLSTLEDKLNADHLPHITILIPGQDVLQTTLHVPAAQKRHLQKTLPFLIEENIASPIEDMHLSAGCLKNNTAIIYAISHVLMAFWHNLIKQHEINADMVLPDNLLASLKVGELKIVIDGVQASFHYTGQPVISTTLDNLDFIADSFISSLNEQPPTAALLVLEDNLSESHNAVAQALATQLDIEGLKTTVKITNNCFEYRCVSILNNTQSNSTDLPNLQSGEYKVITKHQRENAPNWRAIAAILILCVFLKPLFDIGTGLYMNSKVNQVNNQITTLYKNLFPQDKKIINAKAQMKNHLNQQSGSPQLNGFGMLFSHLAKAIQSITINDQAQIQQFRYNEQTQTLMLSINVQQVAQLEKLKQALESNDIKTAILSANEEKQWVKGRIRLIL